VAAGPEGYFRVPRKLVTCSITNERKWALVWMASQASYVERTMGSVILRVGETPVLSLTMFEVFLGWSRKSVRNFLEYALSPACATDTGIRVRVGQRVMGHVSGHEGGHVTGHTYVIGLVKDTAPEGHVSGHEGGHVTGHTGKKTEENTGKNAPPTGESRGGKSENGTAPRKRAVPTPLPDDWSPTAGHREDCEESGIDLEALLDDFRFFWRTTKGTKANWNLTFSKRIAAVRSTGKFRKNGKPASTGVTSVPDDAVAAAIVARMQG
jgi:hypothetical protein